METEAIQQPFENAEFFQLWGLRLGGGWAFNGHMKEAQKNLRIRAAILQKVSKSEWGLEGRIVAVTARAPIVSLANYGPTITGLAARLEYMDEIDTKILNPAARGAAGAGTSIRREILFT